MARVVEGPPPPPPSLGGMGVHGSSFSKRMNTSACTNTHAFVLAFPCVRARGRALCKLKNASHSLSLSLFHTRTHTHTHTHIHTYILPSHNHTSAAPTVRDGPRDHRSRLVSGSDGAVRLAEAALPYPAQLLQWLVFVRDPGLGYEGPESDRGRCLRLRLRLPYCQSDWFWTWVAPDAFAVRYVDQSSRTPEGLISPVP